MTGAQRLRRVFLAGTPLSVVSCFLRTARCQLWSCEQSLRASGSFDAFLEDFRREATQDQRWVLDYSAVEALAKQMVCSETVLNADICPLSRIHEALCVVAKQTDLKHLHITLSTHQCMWRSIALVRAGSLGLKLDSVEISIHASALSKENLNLGGMPTHANGDYSAPELFRALANTEGAKSSLRRLSIVMIEHATRPSTPWSDTMASALSSLLLHTQLTHVTLNYMNLQHCSQLSLQGLAEALDNSSSTLRSLDLKAVTLLTQQILRNGMLQHCGALRHLDLSHTRLGDVCSAQLVKDLHKGIGGWHQLRQLALSQCEISDYSLQLFAHGLQICNATERGGREDAIAPSACIEELNFGSNYLTDDAIFHISTCLMQCFTLRQLDLRHNHISKRGVEQLLSSLAHITTLRCLRLRSNRLTDEGAHSFATYSKRWLALEELDLTRCRITTRSLVELAAAISSLPQLRILRLAGNDLRPVKVGENALLMPQKDGNDFCEERELPLFAYDASYMRPGSVAKCTTSGCHGFKVPTSFELDRRDREAGRVRYCGNEAIEQDAAERKCLEALGDPFRVFGAALGSCQQLRVLDLSDCSLRDESFVSMGPCLVFPQLEELYLSANPLFAACDASLEVLTRILRSAAATLHTLDISFTGLSDLGVSFLCDGPLNKGEEGDPGVLGQLKQLEVLRFSYTNSGPLAIEAARDTVAELPQLQALCLDGSMCSGKDLVDLLESLCYLRNLRFVGLTRCVSDHRQREQVILSQAFKRLLKMGVDVVI